jgi:hypothetical protein
MKKLTLLVLLLMILVVGVVVAGGKKDKTGEIAAKWDEIVLIREKGLASENYSIEINEETKRYNDRVEFEEALIDDWEKTVNAFCMANGGYDGSGWAYLELSKNDRNFLDKAWDIKNGWFWDLQKLKSDIAQREYERSTDFRDKMEGMSDQEKWDYIQNNLQTAREIWNDSFEEMLLSYELQAKGYPSPVKGSRSTNDIEIYRLYFNSCKSIVERGEGMLELDEENYRLIRGRFNFDMRYATEKLNYLAQNGYDVSVEAFKLAAMAVFMKQLDKERNPSP